MGNLGREIDPANAPPDDGYTLIPKGTWVPVVLDKSEIKETKKIHPDGHPMGRYISAEFVVIDGPYEGRRIFENINFENRNPEPASNGKGTKGEQTEKIAERFLSSLAVAIGVLRFSDTSELEGQPTMAKLSIEEGRGDFPAKNKITEFKARDGASAPGGADVKPAATKPVAPWGSKK